MTSSTIPHCGQDEEAVGKVETRHGRGHVILHVPVFMPFRPQFMFTSHRVMPAVRLAQEHVEREQLLPGHRFHWIPGDSKCNSRDAPMHAFDTVTRYKVALFLGPVCDYSLAPVARFAPYWHIPIVAPGGFAHNFGTEKLAGPEGPEYPLLTRVGYTFNSLARTFLDILEYFRWQKVKVMYNPVAHSDIVPKFCHLAGGALGKYLDAEVRRRGRRMGFDIHLMRSHEVTSRPTLLEDELAADYSGKFGVW